MENIHFNKNRHYPSICDMSYSALQSSEIDNVFGENRLDILKACQSDVDFGDCILDNRININDLFCDWYG